MGPVIHDAQRDNAARRPRWVRRVGAELLAQYRDLCAQGVCQRQAAQRLDVPRTMIPAWCAWQPRLDAGPQGVAFVARRPGLASLHRLVLAYQAVSAPLAVKPRAAAKAAATMAETRQQVREHRDNTHDEPVKRGPGCPAQVALGFAQGTQELEATRQAHRRLTQQREQGGRCLRASAPHAGLRAVGMARIEQAERVVPTRQATMAFVSP